MAPKTKTKKNISKPSTKKKLIHRKTMSMSEKIIHKKHNFDSSYSLLIGIIFFIALLLVSTNIILHNYGTRFSVFSVFVWIIIFGVFVFLPSITQKLTRESKVILKKRINGFILMVLFFICLFLFFPFLLFDIFLGIFLFVLLYFFVFMYITRNARHKNIKQPHKHAEYYIYAFFGAIFCFAILYLLHLLLFLVNISTIQVGLIYTSLLMFWLFNDLLLINTKYYREQQKIATEIDTFDRQHIN